MAVGHKAATENPDIERLSALMDGELDAQEAARLLDALCRDPGLQQRWSDLQLAGDAIRSTDVAACHVDAFCARVRTALADEPTVLAPRRRSPLRRYAVPGVAIAASVAAIAFVAVPLLRAPAPEMAALQAVPATATTATAAAVEPAGAQSNRATAAIANARALDAYFAAHRELTAGTPLPRATAYLRTGAGDR